MIKFIFYFASVLLSLIDQSPKDDTIYKNPVNISNDLCHLCYMENNTVTLCPCHHIIGNYCANKLFKGPNICPLCTQEIEYYKDIVHLTNFQFESRSPYRFRVLTETELYSLKSSIKNGMTDEEFMARFWYLRRCQEPDEDLLWSINLSLITRDDRKKIAILKKELLSNISSEIFVYKDNFRKNLNDEEYYTVSSFYRRFQKLYRGYELEIRKTYLDFMFT
ncbi:uncharacterized protein LOC126904783 isoform X2 [Daktulosphaira vitifoliae]|uniref:uncharacterized protein LOC126904783 isoform X2 n=1 Tax=Daktulosphaira vitifoliae TaxID=58002 RepID=UPI0021A9B675|nr:uncharacterized protein LOC126904783 isoform X2 [Daktulosphaira vitifoliae]